VAFSGFFTTLSRFFVTFSGFFVMIYGRFIAISRCFAMISGHFATIYDFLCHLATYPRPIATERLTAPPAAGE
jgi:hypothetical protein